MGFFDRIFGKAKEERFEENEMTLTQLEEFIEKNLNKGFEPFIKNIRVEHSNLQASADSMLDKLKILEGAPYSGSNDPMLIRKAVGSRNSFVNKMKGLARKIQTAIEDDFDSISNFHNDVAALINFTNAKTVNEYMFLKELFEREADGVIESFKKISEADKSFGRVIKEFQDANSKFLGLQKGLAEFKELSEDWGKRRAMLSEYENRIKELAEEKNKKAGQLDKLIESDEWESFLAAQKTRDGLANKLSNVKSDFAQNVTKLERPLKKYQWLVNNKILDCYLEYSFDSLDSVLSKDPDAEIFNAAVKDMKTKIIEGKIDLKDADKFLSTIDSMLSENTIGKILREHVKVSEELKNIEEKINSLDTAGKKRYLEGEVESLGREFETAVMEKEKIVRQIDSVELAKKEKLKELEGLVSNTSNKKIVLKIQN